MVDDFGARIAKLRKARKLSQRALADRAKALDPNLRLSHSALGNYERNVTVPRLAEAVALADVLDVSLDFLLRGETYRTLPLRNLTEEQIQLLLDLSAYFRRNNGLDQEKKGAGAYQGASGVVCADDERNLWLSLSLSDIFCARVIVFAFVPLFSPFCF